MQFARLMHFETLKPHGRRHLFTGIASQIHFAVSNVFLGSEGVLYEILLFWLWLYCSGGFLIFQGRKSLSLFLTEKKISNMLFTNIED